MRVFLLWCAAITVVSCTDPPGETAHDMRDLLKQVVMKYEGEEGVQRLMKRSAEANKATMEEFAEFVKTVDDINADSSVPFSAEYNSISIMSKEEKDALVGVNASQIEREISFKDKDGYKTDMRRVKRGASEQTKLSWDKRGGVTDVKNQGSCGSCWAFSAVSCLEGVYYAETGEKKTFAEQEYLDCVYDGNINGIDKRDGCKGGWMPYAYYYNYLNDRMAESKSVAYKGIDSGVCNYGKVANGLTKGQVVSIKTIRSSDAYLQTAVNSAVVSVCIKVTNTFHMYRSGVYTCTASDCNTDINHAVTVVGYGETASGQRYWTVKNSWGATWGDGGFIQMTRDDAKQNIVNINNYAFVPQVVCRRGQTCTPPDYTDADKETNRNDDEGVLDKGKPVKCGKIVHYGKRCLSIDDSADKNIDLSSVCERTWCLTDKDYLFERATDMCVNVLSDKGYLQLGETCKTRWEISRWNSFRIKNKGDGRCMHPGEKMYNYQPEESTRVLAKEDCNEFHLQFFFEIQMCWEVESGKSLEGKDLKGPKRTSYRKLFDAKQHCMENKQCKGLNYNSKDGSYTQRSEESMVQSANSSDKAYLKVDCLKACVKGEERCEDGDCRANCGKAAGCAPGTVKCSDGVCRHEHMCER